MRREMVKPKRSKRTERTAGSPEELVDALAQAAFVTMAVLNKIGADNDLSLTQLRVCGILRDRRPRMAALADYLGLEKSTMTGLVDRAEKRGLMARAPSADDGPRRRRVPDQRGNEARRKPPCAVAGGAVAAHAAAEPRRSAPSPSVCSCVCSTPRRTDLGNHQGLRDARGRGSVSTELSDANGDRLAAARAAC